MKIARVFRIANKGVYYRNLETQRLFENTENCEKFAEEWLTSKTMDRFLVNMLNAEQVEWEFVPILTPKSRPVSETILDCALQMNAKIIIASTKSSGQVFGSLENRYEVGKSSSVFSLFFSDNYSKK